LGTLNNPALEESGVKTGHFAFYQKISFINETGRFQGYVQQRPPKMSVYQSLWYLLTPSLQLHKLL
jgi:hypothetical protein